MRYMGVVGKIIIFNLLLLINANFIALAHEGNHDKENKTNKLSQSPVKHSTKKQAEKKQLLTTPQLNTLRRDRQRDKLHELFTKVIGTQNPEDQYSLGQMFKKGDGVEKDDIQAYVWTALSLTNGYPGATKTLRDLESAMSSYEVNYAIDLLRKIRELR
ncbi:hypothetical protein MNBD_GAMMA22-1477 [hydrothermal vent metagenome]|uniref:Sel1 repeat family protein n=1 Tax=hydrothermal vent metagenome TaxID=652676 RepID=A0A3B1ACC4_9ZZZZ